MKEIEYKFLVTQDISSVWLDIENVCEIQQGYLTKPGEGATVRIRLGKWASGNREAFLTIKSRSEGMSRDEWEYPILFEDAEEMMKLCELKILKRRALIKHGIYTIELDTFDGDLKGLVMAEIEVNDVDEKIELPSYLGKDVSTDHRYTNISLAKHGIPKD
jgi:adenylate cyclase